MKKLTVAAMVTVLTLGAASAAVAGSPKCVVQAVEGTKVTVECSEDAGKIKVGDQVKVKVKKAKGKGGLESC
ncbi:MAG: hypothetical protein CSB32_00400 [Desulfobacterales bacterium]|nr:MAG: hypothetical protein CSB32_00400 [Desulfobacterales bacterium]